MTKINIPIEMQLIYINGGNVTLSPTDIQITGTINGRPQALIIIPLSTAKGFVNAIGVALKDYEDKTGIKILETNEIATSLKK